MSTTPIKFSAKTTSDQVVNLFADQVPGKTYLVTGGNTGLGLETCRVLAGKGGKVILCSRGKDNGEKAITTIKSEFPNADVSLLLIDLSSLESIQSAAKQVLKDYQKLNVLINNAGIMACPRALTKDGFESQLGVNHIGHFALTMQLLPLLESSATPETPSRIVNLSSMAQFVFAPDVGIQFDNGETEYNSWHRYGSSKLANVLFTYELHKRYHSKNIIAVALHPGLIFGTELKRHGSIMNMWRMVKTLFSKKGGIAAMNAERYKSVPEGTATTILATLDPKIVPGAYYYDCKKSEGEGLHALAYDDALAAKLWEFSEKAVAGKV
jgi:retinol dehydrogenase 12